MTSSVVRLPTARVWLSAILLLSVSAILPLPGYGRHVPTSASKISSVRPTCLRQLWHDAGAAEVEGNWKLGRDAYAATAIAAGLDTSDVEHWYLGAAFFGMARLSARLGDTSDTHRALQAAFSYGFWNFDLVTRDNLFASILGVKRLESLVGHYRLAQSQSKSTWFPQPVLLLVPSRKNASSNHCQARPLPDSATLQRAVDSLEAKANDTPTQNFSSSASLRASFALHSVAEHTTFDRHLPLIIALHGGNASYEEFSRHWIAIADSLHCYILIPPGPTRYSEVCNSWDASFDQMDDAVQHCIDSFVSVAHYHPTIYLAGFSQGAKAAIEIGLVHSDRIRGILAISGYLDQMLPTDLITSAQANGLRIYALSGSLDSKTFVHSLELGRNQAEREHLPFQLTIEPGMIHEVPSDLPKRIHAIWEWLNPPA